jgi:hypothetical protein
MPNKNNTLIILDWDNTLFPTTWVVRNNINLNDIESKEKHTSYFLHLDNILSKLLHFLTKHGKVVIVTNAMPVWVKISSSVLEKTTKVLKNIKVVSARKSYQPHFQNMMEWKKRAFKDEVANELQTNNTIHIISIGDAEYEYQALIDLHKWEGSQKNKILKSIKFLEEPTHDTLIDQLEVLHKAFPKVHETNKHLDLKFKISN